MSVATSSLFRFEGSFASEVPELSQPWSVDPAPAPRLLALNEALAAELGVDPAALRTPEGLALLTGTAEPEPGGVVPVAQAYAGHQFGGFSPRLGDGRALLLGEVVDVHGRRRDLHLKGSGRTPFARGAADGKAVVGPMLREFVLGEAMHALGVPTTRALAVVATGEQVARETLLPGAVLARVAASHLRVGTFEYARTALDADVVRRLADYAIARHHPAAASADEPYLALFEAVVEAQASLVAQWMLVGFVHGVMNTDNVAISGETIDFGPCAFIDVFDPGAVFSSIDHSGRYAYGNQPHVAQWNLARFAETLLALIAEETEAAVAAVTPVLQSFPQRFHRAWSAGMAAKLGFARGGEASDVLANDLLTLMRDQAADYTEAFRALSAAVRGDTGPGRALFVDMAAFEAWAERWLAAIGAEGRDPAEVAAAMDAVNPVYIPRNHKVEEALAAATAGDLGPFDRLVDAVSRPFEERPGLEAFAEPAPESFGAYRTFCGT